MALLDSADDVFISIAPKKIVALLSDTDAEFPEAIMELIKLQFATLRARFNSSISFELICTGKDAKSAAELEVIIKDLKKNVKQFLNDEQQLKEKAGEKSKKAQLYFTAALEKLLVKRKENILTVAMVNDTLGDKLMTLLFDLITESPEKVKFAKHAQATWKSAATPAENETAEIIRRLVPSAAGVSKRDLIRVAQSASPPSIYSFPDKRLSMLLLTDRTSYFHKELYKNRTEEFQIGGPNSTPNPSAFVAIMSKTLWLGYATMLNPEHITRVTCKVEGKKASGQVFFRVPWSFEVDDLEEEAEDVDDSKKTDDPDSDKAKDDKAVEKPAKETLGYLYKGVVSYVAEKNNGRWQIIEFLLPARNNKYRLQKDGTWKGTYPRGDMSADKPEDKRVELAVNLLLDAKPLADASVYCYHQKDPIFNGQSTFSKEDNKTTLKLRPGKYYVTVTPRYRRPRVLEIPHKYAHPLKSGLTVEIKKDTKTIELKLESTKPTAPKSEKKAP